jgi:hypothetical protein
VVPDFLLEFEPSVIRPNGDLHGSILRAAKRFSPQRHGGRRR